MKRNVLIIAVITILPLGALAQGVNIFAGYSFMRFSGPFTGFDYSHLNGWNASVTRSFTRHLGITAEFNGQYGSGPSETIFLASPVRTIPGQHVRLHTFLFGPEFRYQRGRAVLFGHTLAGVAVGKIGTRVGVSLRTPSGTGASTYLPAMGATGFAAGLGGGLDLKVNRRYMIRVGQLDYLPTGADFGIATSSTENNLRYSAGIVLRF
jgi:hypothetical protein